MFSKEDSAQISDKFVAVRLLGGQDLDDEGKTFMRRYGVRGFPTILGMTADGAVLQRSFDRTLDGFLNGMNAAETSNNDFLKKEADLKGKTDAASMRELAGLYNGRAQYEDARGGYEKLVSVAQPELDDQLALLDVVEALGDAAARKSLLDTLVKTRKDHEKNINWRIDLALADLPTQATSREEFMSIMGKQKDLLTTLLAEVTEVGDQAVVRSRLGRALMSTGDMAGVKHFQWILDNARDSKAAPSALWVIAQEEFKKARDPFTGDWDPERLEAGRTFLKEILEKHPDTPRAKNVARMMPQIDAHIEKAKDAAAKKAEEANKEEEPAEAGK